MGRPMTSEERLSHLDAVHRVRHRHRRPLQVQAVREDELVDPPPEDEEDAVPAEEDAVPAEEDAVPAEDGECAPPAALSASVVSRRGNKVGWSESFVFTFRRLSLATVSSTLPERESPFGRLFFFCCCSRDFESWGDLKLATILSGRNSRSDYSLHTKIVATTIVSGNRRIVFVGEK